MSQVNSQFSPSSVQNLTSSPANLVAESAPQSELALAVVTTLKGAPLPLEIAITKAPVDPPRPEQMPSTEERDKRNAETTLLGVCRQQEMSLP